MADVRITPIDPNALDATDWLKAIDLTPGIANVIINFPNTLRADSTFINTVTAAVWAQISDRPYSTISDGDALLSRRALDYQSDPALI
jgi:hypothetical protein